MTEDYAKLQKAIVNFADQLLKLADQVAHLEAAVNVLKTLAIAQMSPDDPIAGLKQLRQFEEVLLAADPQGKERKQALDMADAVREWMKRGKPTVSDS